MLLGKGIMKGSKSASYMVRKANAGDASMIAALVKPYEFNAKGEGQLIALSMADIFAVVNDGAFYVAEKNGKVVGCCSIVEYGLNHGMRMNIAELRTLAVDKRHRGKGIGTALIQACAREAKSRGHKALYTLTQKQNFGMLEKAGFVKSDIPLEKRSQDCVRCPLYENGCNETAFMIGL